MVVSLRALICIHGLLSSHADFNFLTNELKKYYDKVICYDLPGHGTNSEKFNTENIKR